MSAYFLSGQLFQPAMGKFSLLAGAIPPAARTDFRRISGMVAMMMN